MLPTIGQRLEISARSLLPIVTALLFILAGVVAWPLPHIGDVAPLFGLVAIYYWAVHRPDLLHPLAAFLLGLLHDAVNLLPLGLSALVFVLLYQLVLSQRRFFMSHSFFMLWAGFSLVILIASIINLTLLSLINGQIMTLLPVLLQAIITVAIFPFPAWLLIWLQRVVLSQG